MNKQDYPDYFAKCIVPENQALKQVVRSNRKIASGFATSEPHSFYQKLWGHIQSEDVTNLNIRQALFMAPHKICVGDAMTAKGLLEGLTKNGGGISILKSLAEKANNITKKVDGLHKLVEHYNEMLERKVSFTSAFIGGATSMIIPDNAITKMIAPDFVGRNTTRIGITDMQSIHFPEAVDSMGYDPDNNPRIDAFVLVLTPPNANGEMSHGPANGANGEILNKILENCDVDLLLYINPLYPFTRGYGDAPNTVHIDRFRKIAEAGRLFVVEDQSKIPALPANSFEDPTLAELRIAEHVVNHMEANLNYTKGRAIQVGFGGTGVLAIRALKDSSWEGRSYTEMLEPFTLALWESGKISGSHFIESDGRRTQLDGKMVCTFTICEKGSDFYQKIHDNPAIIIAPASRVVIPEGFYHGLGINNCLAIDYHGHVNSGGRYQNHHSGVGGGAQIFRGLGRGGVGYLCLKSTFLSQEGKLRSAIMPFMPKGTPISHIGPDLMGGREGARFFIVTEHGVAPVSGKSQSEFIRAIISVADPEFKDWLKQEAWKEFRVSV